MEVFRHIKVDVTCHWSETPPVYRIYVNSDLITERTFSWPGYQNFIRENIVCHLEKGIHKLRIENCNGSGNFELKNFEVDGANCMHPNHIDPTNKEITFVLHP